MRSSKLMSRGTTEDLLIRIAQREPIGDPVAVVVAHPDDETVGAGATLPLFQCLRLVQVTDGAPRNLHDAHAAGFAGWADYATAREHELYAALRVGGVRPSDVIRLGIPDQTASLQLVSLAARLREILGGFAVVLTHAYEGGHPDHDAVAFAVHAAGVPVIEMAGYHAAADGGIEVGRFLADTNAILVPLTEQERAHREAMLACFATQRRTLAPFFNWTEEGFRIAPRYDFTRPASSRVYYDAFDWGMTSARWCALATRAIPCCAF
jgi:LmbE family N-acetylglucosaminyl deacetylase